MICEAGSRNLRHHLQKQISLRIERRLCGRTHEEAMLVNSYYASLTTNANSPATKIIISGESGMGKSVLAETLRQSVSEDDGFFIRGKFDQSLEYGSAYSVIASAFDEFIYILEKRGDASWNEVANPLRHEIHKTDHRQILFEAIPSLRRIFEGRRGGATVCIGGSSSEDLSNSNRSLNETTAEVRSSHTKLHYLMKKFIRIVSSVGDPIVMLLDDMQWANASSLDLLKTLMLSARNPFIFMFTMRPVQKDHPFYQLIYAHEETPACLTEIELRGLSEDAICELTSMQLGIPESKSSRCRPLSDFLCRVTNGSEYFRVGRI
eukprot:scaffold2372_cov198-Alexandrium_tamarense.AAC.38